MLCLLPVLLWGAGALATGCGVAAGIKGFCNMNKAQEIGEKTQRQYEEAMLALDSTRQRIKKSFEDLNEKKITIIATTFNELLELFGKLNRANQTEELSLLTDIASFRNYQAVVLEAQKALAGGVSAYVSATSDLAGCIGITDTMTLLHRLSTGDAYNPLPALLKGSAFARGGDRMPLDPIIIDEVLSGVEVLREGLALAAQGERVLMKARLREADVHETVIKIRTSRTMLGSVLEHISEIERVMAHLNSRLRALISEIEVERIDLKNARDSSMLYTCVLIARSLREIIKTPVVEENDGRPTTKLFDLMDGYSCY